MWGRNRKGEKEMQFLICDKDIAEKDFPVHVNTKHDGRANPRKYIMIIQKRLEEIEKYREISRSYWLASAR